METPSNLPTPRTSFVGREREIREVRGLLEAHRVVTIVGPGGMGKSRVALEVAQRSLDAFPDGVWRAELADLPAQPEAIAHAIADSLRLRDQSGLSAADVVALTMRHRRVLILLDECERVVDALSGVLGRLLEACPQLSVLATSRQPLRIVGEVVHDLPALAVGGRSSGLADLLGQECVALFIDRLRATNAGIRIDERSIVVIHDICSRLDGLPLAIELAAAHARHLQLAELLDRLDDQPALLGAGPRDAPERQRSVPATVDWSVALLAPPARELFLSVAVFADGFDGLSAEAVREDRDGPTTDVLLAELVDHSLVAATEGVRGTTRYRLLEPVRQHALSLLTASGRKAQVRQRHAAHFAELAGAFSAAGAADEPRWLDVLEAEHDNLRAALEWTVRHDPRLGLRMSANLASFWEWRGHVGEGRAWLERTSRDVPESLSDEAAALGLATLRIVDGDVDNGRALLGTLLASGDRVSPTTRARALILLAQLDMGEPARVREILAAALDVAHRAGNAELTCEIVGWASDDEWVIGDVETARIHAAEALQAARRLRAPRLIFTPASVLARDATFSARWRADDLWDECLRNARELGDPALVHFALMFRALRASQRGDAGAAAESLFDGSPRRVPIAGELDLLHFVEHVGVVLGQSGHSGDGLRLVWAARRLVGDRCCDSIAWQALVGAEIARLTSAVGADVEAVRADAATLSFDEAVTEAERWVEELHAETRPAAQRSGPLSRRETEIARLTAAGLTNREIGQRLFISERTAEAHVQHILNKLALANRAQIAAWVTRQS